MTTGSSFRIGNTEGTIVHYGESAGPPGHLFPEAPPSERDQACAKHLIDGNNLGFAYSSLLLRRGEDVVVIDSGPGTPHDALGNALRATGAASDAVQQVILSHAHPDHVGEGWSPETRASTGPGSTRRPTTCSKTSGTTGWNPTSTER